MAKKVKHILLACSSGVVTSTIARKRVEDLLDAHGFGGRYEITQMPMDKAVEHAREYDFAVTTSQPPEGLRCPQVNGIPYLMGRGVDKPNREILQLMED